MGQKIEITLQFKDDGTIAVVDQARGKIDALDKSVKGSTGGLDAYRDGWVAITAKVAIAGAAFYAGKRLVYDMSKEIASAGNDIARMSRNFNMSTDDLQKWSYAARMADVDIQGFGEGFKFLTQSMGEALQGSGDAAKAFRILGVNLKDTTGRTKDQQTVMLETIGSLEKYADGVNRDALMLAVFGRGWLSVKPLIDQGTKAIEENKKEAERLNTILGKDIIRALSESEDAFKKWEMVWKVAKAETFQPMITIFTSMFERILALRTAFKEGGVKGAFQDILAAQEEQRINVLPPAAWTKEWVAGWTPPSKPEASTLTDLQKYYDFQKSYYESLSKQAEQMERGAYGGMEEGGFWQTLKDQKDIQENLKRVEGERAQQLADDMFPAEDKVRAITEKMTEIGEKLRLTLVEMRGLVTEFGWEDYTAGADAANEGTRKLNEMIIQNTKSAEKMFETNKFTEGIITGIADVWSSSFSTMRRSQQSFSEWFKGTWLDMADYAIDQTQKMMMNYLLLGSVSGKSGGTSFFGTSSGGYGGLIGGILGAVKLQEGGQFWVDRPTPLLVGEGGKREFISVTPESKMNRRPEGGDTTIINSYMYIEATDVDSFERKYGGSVTKIVHRNKKSGGMRG